MPHFIILFLVVLFPSLSFAASFDCTRATTKMEKIICSDPQLSKRDEDLSAAYSNALKDSFNPGAIKRQQRDWLVDVRKHCDDIACISNAYSTRIAQLASVNNAVATLPTGIINTDVEACRIIANHLNHGTENTLRASPTAKQPPKELDSVFGAGGTYWLVDLDNDGIRDHLAITDEGTMHVNTAYILSGKNGATVSMFGSLGENEDIGLDLDLLVVGGRYYIASQGKYWHLSKSGEFQSVCQFKQIAKPVAGLISGRENPVCSKIKPGHIQHVDYSLAHKLDELPNEERFWSKTPKDGLAHVDIDNDGQLDNVVRLDFIHGAGRGCGVTYIAVTDKTLSEIPDTKLNKLLLEELGGYPCGPNLNVFVNSGVTYVDAEDGYTIYRIKADKAEKVCEFQMSRSIVEAIDVGQNNK